MYTFEYQLRVRYGDTDKMGYVYYGNYAYYLEQARAEAMRTLGIPYKILEETGIMMPVTRMNVKYIQPAFYDDLLTIKTTIPVLPGRIIQFNYDIFNSQGVCINVSETQLIFFDIKTNKPCSAPAILIDKLRSYYSDATH